MLNAMGTRGARARVTSATRSDIQGSQEARKAIPAAGTI